MLCQAKLLTAKRIKFPSQGLERAESPYKKPFKVSWAMRFKDLNTDPQKILREALAEAIAGIGLRGEDARKAASRARREMSEERWRGIVAEANRRVRMPAVREDELERSVIIDASIN